MTNHTEANAASETSARDSGSSLRALGSKRGLHIGAAVRVAAFRDDPAYREILAREFNMLTPENAMKFGPLRPSRDEFAFENADEIVGFAQEHDMAVRGHALVWHNMLPDWLKQTTPNYDDWIDILRGHIHTVTKHYRGKVEAWDVLNEAIGDDCKMRDTPFLRAFGPDYVTMAFHWAHEGDPGAKLFYNDYSADAWGSKAKAVYRLVSGLVKRGVPIHGVGLQMHLCLRDPPKRRRVAKNIRGLNALGLEVHITEMDIRVKEPCTEDDLRQQARVYRDILEVCLAADNCKALVTWGVTDRYSWVPDFFPGTGAPLLFDSSGRPKPAYHAMRDALAGK